MFSVLLLVVLLAGPLVIIAQVARSLCRSRLQRCKVALCGETAAEDEVISPAEAKRRYKESLQSPAARALRRLARVAAAVSALKPRKANARGQGAAATPTATPTATPAAAADKDTGLGIAAIAAAAGVTSSSKDPSDKGTGKAEASRGRGRDGPCPTTSSASSRMSGGLAKGKRRLAAPAKAENKAKVQALSEMADYQRVHGVRGDLSRAGPLSVVPNQLACWRKRGPQRSAGIPTKVPSTVPQTPVGSAGGGAAAISGGSSSPAPTRQEAAAVRHKRGSPLDVEVEEL